MPHYTMPDGEKLYVREFGQGEPVLVLSGLGMQSWQWLPFLFQHRKKYRFYIPDWRGFGGSAQCRIPKLDAISSHWQDLNCFLEQQTHHQFRVIAYSMGATTAMHGLQYGHFQKHVHSYLHIDQTPKICVDAEWSHGLFAEKHKDFKTILQNIAELLAQNTQYNLVSELKPTTRTGRLLVRVYATASQAISKHSFISKSFSTATLTEVYASYSAFRLYGLVHP